MQLASARHNTLEFADSCLNRCGAAGSISSKLLQAHLNYLHTHTEGLKGVDGRCLANLTWALAKLDLSSDDSALTTELALMVAPFIIRTLDTSSPQVWFGAASRQLGLVWGACSWQMQSNQFMNADIVLHMCVRV